MILRMQIIGFVGLAILILFGAHFLVYQGIVHFFPTLSVVGKYFLTVALIVFGLSFIICSLLIHWQENTFTRGLYFLSGFWMGMLANLILLLFGAWFLSFIAHFLGWEISRAVVGSLALVFAFLVSVGGSYNAFHPRVREITVHIPGLPTVWQGKKIVQLSDVHLGAIYQAPWLAKVVAQVNAVHPEAVLITGDLFDGMDGSLDALVRPFDQLRTPQGVYFATGNHETYLGVAEVFATLSKTQVHILDNRVVDVQGLKLVGLSYPERGVATSTVLETLKGLRPQYDGEPNILLFHSPVYTTEFAAAGINLQLSGHTHKGQQYPFGLITALIYKGLDYGLYPMGKYTLYTSNGVGTWGPAMRVGNTPEIVAITLEK